MAVWIRRDIIAKTAVIILVLLVILAGGCTSASPAPATSEPASTTPEPSITTPASSPTTLAASETPGPALITETVPATTESAPIITTVRDPVIIKGANWWLFAVDDGQPLIAVSAELDGELLMGRFDITGGDAAISWLSVAGPADTNGIPISDHWHIYAHGYHWLVFSVAGDTASYLLKVDNDFQRLALVPVGHTDGPTNDMFLVAEPDGVAVGHFAPGYGHTVHRFDMEAKKTGQLRIGGGKYIHANGSSAIPVEGGYRLFASQTLDPFAAGAIRLIEFDSQWSPVSVKDVFNEVDTNAAMAMAVLLDSDYTIMHLRVRAGVSEVQEDGASRQPGSPLPDDSGSLVRVVLAPDGTAISRETLVEDGVNRPHTTLVGDLMITTWEENGSARLRIDRIR